MKKILTLSLTTMIAAIVMVGIATVLPRTASAEGNKAVAAETTKPTTTATSEKTYNYVAQLDDTYSQMARKAIQTYGVNNKIKLSQAEIIAAETNMTIQAGSPELLIGQKVSIKESVVKDWVAKAQKLTPEQEAAWNVYTVGVNFNTNAVGQSK